MCTQVNQEKREDFGAFFGFYRMVHRCHEKVSCVLLWEKSSRKLKIIYWTHADGGNPEAVAQYKVLAGSCHIGFIQKLEGRCGNAEDLLIGTIERE